LRAGVLKGTGGYSRGTLGVLSAYCRRTRLKQDGIRKTRDALLCVSQPRRFVCRRHRRTFQLPPYPRRFPAVRPPITPRSLFPEPASLPSHCAAHPPQRRVWPSWSVSPVKRTHAQRHVRARKWAGRGAAAAYADPPRGHVYCHGTRVRPLCGTPRTAGAPAHSAGAPRRWWVEGGGGAQGGYSRVLAVLTGC
jgi:hypothetical protein